MALGCDPCNRIHMGIGYTTAQPLNPDIIFLVMFYLKTAPKCRRFLLTGASLIRRHDDNMSSRWNFFLPILLKPLILAALVLPMQIHAQNNDSQLHKVVGNYDAIISYSAEFNSESPIFLNFYFKKNDSDVPFDSVHIRITQEDK